MKKTIPNYMVSLSNENFDILEEIFERMYSKFITLYWLINDYNDLIETLDYRNKNKEYNILKISLEIKDKSDVPKIVKELKDHVKDNDSITISKKKDTIYIEIIGEEPGLEIKEDENQCETVDL